MLRWLAVLGGRGRLRSFRRVPRLLRSCRRRLARWGVLGLRPTPTGLGVPRRVRSRLGGRMTAGAGHCGRGRHGGQDGQSVAVAGHNGERAVAEGRGQRQARGQGQGGRGKGVEGVGGGCRWPRFGRRGPTWGLLSSQRGGAGGRLGRGGASRRPGTRRTGLCFRPRAWCWEQASCPCPCRCDRRACPHIFKQYFHAREAE